MGIINYSGNWRAYLEYSTETVSQNIAGNQSTVRVKIWIGMPSGCSISFGNTYGNTVTVSINGSSQSLAVGPLYLNGSKKFIGQLDFTVGHHADGTGSANISFNSNMSNITYAGLVMGNAIGSHTHVLGAIPRTSSISVGVGTIGSPMTITVNRQSSSFTHTLRYAWGSKTGTIASNVGASHSWTIPNDFANDIPKATSGMGTLFVDTYNGSSKIGTQQVNFTASLPASVKPSFTGITLTDTNLAARNLLSGTNFLQVISNIQVDFNGQAGSYGSTITGYKAEIVNRNQVTTSNGGKLGLMNFNGSATIRASVVDSRGRWSDSRDVTINVIEYFAPSLSFTALRTRASPNIIQIVRNARIAPITLSGSQKNIMTLSFKVAPLGSTSYTADNGSTSGSWTTQHTLTNSAANMAGNYPANKSFVIVGTLSDKFTSTEFSATIATESVVMSYDKDGRVGIGKVAENGPAGSVDVAGNIYAGGKQIQQHRMTQNDGRAFSDPSGTWDTTVTGFTIKNTSGPNPAGDWGLLQNIWSDTKKTFQLFFGFNGSIFTRQSYDANSWKWRDWREFAFTDHPMLQEKPLKTLTMGFPYSMKANLVRKGDVVTISLIRNIYSVDSFEHAVMQEKIPVGYRPVVDVHMTVNTNVSQFTKNPNILHFAPDGTIRMTSNTAGRHVMTGTITYITNDPYPN
ncbi:TPA: DUF859 family phage minor structural protein [Streptococcus suis]